MGKRFWVGLVLVAWVGCAIAAGPTPVRKQVESSLLVNGTIDISGDGAVAGYSLKDGSKLPSGIKSMVARVVPQWRFAPLNQAQGVKVTHATMSLRFVAKELDDNKISIEIRSAYFGNDKPGEVISSNGDKTPPRYPQQAAFSGVGGTVYAVLRIGRDGRVEDAIAEQVNLHIVGGENAMFRWREMLAKAALHAARNWTFLPPTKGDQVNAPYWSVRVPVEFVAPGFDAAVAHKWHAYLPGPRARISWSDEQSETGADALGVGGVYPLVGGPKLLTALNPT